MNHQLRFVKLFLFLSYFSTYCTITYEGNGTDGATFKFSVGPTANNILSKQEIVGFYIGANSAGAAEDYAVARAFSGGKKFEALAPQKTTVDQSYEDNPLYNAKINFIDLYGIVNPVVVKDGEKKVYAFKDVAFSKNIYASTNINDANESVTDGILGLKTISNASFILPVQNNAGDTFGAAGSGVALAAVSDISEKDENGKVIKQIIGLEVLNADPASASNNKNIASPLNNSSATLKISNDVTINSNEIDITWSEALNRFYMCFQLTSNSDAGSGARAVVVGYLKGNKLYFQKIAPDAVFSGNNQIVGTGDPNEQVSIIKVRTMTTSTKLNYLIVAGANGAKNTVQNNIYALPLVNLIKPGSFTDNANQGTLANINQTPTDVFNLGKYFMYREFQTPATEPSQVFTTANEAAQVGAGPLPIASTETLADIKISGDTVIVSINSAFSADNAPGVYLSKAMYDDKGKIKSWTPWQRAASTVEQVSASLLDIYNGNFMTLTNTTLSADTVKKTGWNTDNNNGLNSPNEGLLKLLTNDFKMENGGLQSLTDFPSTTSGFSDFSLLIATGVKNLALIESGNLQGGFFKPTFGNFLNNSVSSSNGTISSIPANSKYVRVFGGDLNLIGPIVTSTIATKASDNKSWIFIGGTKGVAALINSSGNGWTGTISNLSDLPNNIFFKKIGDFKNVVKVFGSGDYLYVLTMKALYRVELDSADFSNGAVTKKLIASPTEMGLSQFATFSDVVISESLAIIATSEGMYRVGNGNDIRTANTVAQINWTFISTPEGFGPVFKIYTLSHNVDQNKFTENGQLYVLSAYIGYNNAVISRFSVNLSGAIDNDTVTWIPDIFIKDKRSSFIDFSAFRETFTVLGNMQFDTHSKDVNTRDEDGQLEKPFAQALKPFIASGTFLTFLNSVTLRLELPQDSSIMSSPILLRSANGGLLVSGDFGLKVNE
jgi:hypothetical protein